MTRFEVIGTIEFDEDHPAAWEALDDLNAELSGGFHVLTRYVSGTGDNSIAYLVEEVDEE